MVDAHLLVEIRIHGIGLLFLVCRFQSIESLGRRSIKKKQLEIGKMVLFRYINPLRIVSFLR